MASRPAPSQSEVERAFSDAMAQAGYACGTLEAGTPGFVRFDAPGDRKHRKTGYYRIWLGQYPAGVFGDWKSGQQSIFDFHKEVGTPLSESEQAARRKAIARIKAQATIDQETAQGEVAQQAKQEWAKADPLVENHPYLTRKKITGAGLRSCRKFDGTVLLVVPMWSIDHNGEPEIIGLQKIDPQGGKRFLTGQRTRRAFFVIEGDRSAAVLCEGVATGYSIHQATGASVVVAFDAGNLAPAAKDAAAWLRSQARSESRAEPKFLIAGDDDQLPPTGWAALPQNAGKVWVNAGVKGAMAASEAVGCKWILPAFDGAPSRDRTDFNDLHVAEGAGAVAAQIMGSIERPPVAQDADGERLSYDGPTRDESWRSQVPRTASGAFDGANVRGVEVFIQHHPALRGRLRFNELAQRVEVDGKAIRDNDVSSFRKVMHREGLKARKSDVEDEMVSEAERSGNTYDPLVDYFGALKWDGVKRIDSWLTRYLGVKPTDPDQARYVTTVGRKFLISAVARAMRPGCKVDTMLVLEGPQGGGKSSALRALFGADYFVDHLPDFHSKDSFIQLLGTWCVEVAELSALGKAEVKDVKQFLSRQVDHFRLPHATFALDHPRRTVFTGTVNPGDNGYLRDDENRRFWPVICGIIDRPALAADRDQLWAEAFAAFAAGEKWYLESTENDLAKVEQNERRETSNWDEPLRDWLLKTSRTRATIDEVFDDLTDTKVDQRKKTDRNEIGAAFRRLGWKSREMRDPISKRKSRTFMAPDAYDEATRSAAPRGQASMFAERDPVDDF